MDIYDSTPCELGEGPLWHPLLKKLFWFDIINCTLYSRHNNRLKHWTFDKMVSAAGWIDKENLLIASECSLFIFNINSSLETKICDLEADNNITRSNDGRADPWGGFWIGTMGKNAELGAGSIYRYYQGELHQIINNLTIPNAICFAPDQSCMYYTDTKQKVLWKQPLEIKDGFPNGEPICLIDFNKDNINPDGAITDADGTLWIARWGDSCVSQYSATGQLIQTIKAPSAHTSCPAFGGETLQQLFVTSARQGLTSTELSEQPAGQVFSVNTQAKGIEEPNVIVTTAQQKDEI